MDLNSLKYFAREARKQLLKSVTFKVEYVLSENNDYRREYPKAIAELENKIKSSSKQQVIEEISYTWFNRFTALQYMDLHDLNDVKVILPLKGKTRPKILEDAIAGVFNNYLISHNTQRIVSSFLDGQSQSNDPENQAYRLLIISVCNKLHSKMPFLFERITDYTELLIPDDLLSKSSILSQIREIMTIENCQNIEVIGWLYQFYISDKKDEIFSDLKQRKKVDPENIPAATQLFTPHWIVKYILENSLGRLWMLNNPNSQLINHMRHFFSSFDKNEPFIKINSPEEIKVCDPACGSGHMLTYAFDLLYFIYEEEGYEKRLIPSLILKNNLYGIEIDKRAGGLAAFSLLMKAQLKQTKFLKEPVQPNICVLENIHFENNEINDYINFIGRDLLNNSFEKNLKQFEESNNFGSLIQPSLKDLDAIKERLLMKNVNNDLLLNNIHQRVLKILHQSDYLRQKYHVVVANPPYMGSKGMNNRMSIFLKDNYYDFKSDLFSAFIFRSSKLTLKNGQLGFMTPFVWMFIASYEKLREFILKNTNITSLIQLEYSGFEGATVPICTFTLSNSYEENYIGSYIKLSDFRGASQQEPRTIEAIKNPTCGWFYKVCADEFYNLPGSPIAFWVSEKIYKLFRSTAPLNNFIETREGLTTGSNELFVRSWYEVNFKNIGFNYNEIEQTSQGKHTWFPYVKGGSFRRWYGNFENVVNWYQDGKLLKNFKDEKTNRVRSHNYNGNYSFKKGFTWSGVSSGGFAVRHVPNGFKFDAVGPMGYVKKISYLNIIEGQLNSKVTSEILKILAPTLHFKLGHILNIPFDEKILSYDQNIISKLLELSKNDWDSYELSWHFSGNNLLFKREKFKKLKESYEYLRNEWRKKTVLMRNLEKENNQFFINAYGLNDEINSEVPLNEITLRCNPAYRYAKEISVEEQENKLCVDTLKEFISYSVGCMFGRYSLDKSGLIIANQGDTIEDYLNKISNPSFLPDDDNVIPILELDWFEDDITSRFKQFLKITFGEKNFEENLRFIENSIGKNVRKYFLNDFYKDHIQIYKKRPIYWLFSSPKGNFNALIYSHRYHNDTIPILLDKYLREFLLKLRAEKNTLERLEITSDSHSREKNKAIKEIQKIDNIISELKKWETEVIFPLASQRLKINLDDGVKINYPKFGKALKKISGLN